MADSANSLDKLSFEAAMAELETIVKNLETGKTSLEDSINAYERGIVLKNHCESKLREAQSRIDKIIVKPDGHISAVPLDPEN
ncbi:MAG: exodeoxyribonuclease VII small subunit [Micavibrio aeruginosavorus]|uniref:Exodeoxyribonuclease 7 small subunit n=1 Tax=Micavibrio aeruginosavorus TaxID=349221 RepID=A0A2W5HG06_9BACT|nr:MAG: exodeoxyribonuclease VII small subunit [Micavibrio aeruginosavorus]